MAGWQFWVLAIYASFFGLQGARAIFTAAHPLTGTF